MSVGTMTLTEEAQTVNRNFLSIVNSINHVILFGLTAYILYLAGWELSVINLHVGLCTVGYVLLMSEALMVLTSENVWSRQLTTFKTRSHVHWCLQILGGSLSIAGVFLLYVYNKKHFRTIHSILGIISISILIFLSLSGISVFYAFKLRKILKPVFIKIIHNFLGISCFIIGIVTQCYGYHKGWMIKKVGNEIAIACIVLTAISTLICLYRPLISLYRQISAFFS